MDYIINAYNCQTTQKECQDINDFLNKKGLSIIRYNGTSFNKIAKEKYITPSIMNKDEYDTIISSIENKNEKYLWKFARDFPVSIYYTFKDNTTTIITREFGTIETIHIYNTTATLSDEIQNLERNIYIQSQKISTDQLKQIIEKSNSNTNQNIIILHDIKKILNLLEFCQKNNIDKVEVKKVTDNFEKDYIYDDYKKIISK